MLSLICLITAIAINLNINHYRNNWLSPQKFGQRPSEWKDWRSAGAQKEKKKLTAWTASFLLSGDENKCTWPKCLFSSYEVQFRLMSVGFHRQNNCRG